MEERITDTEDRNLEISQMEKESRAKKKKKERKKELYKKDLTRLPVKMEA